MAQLDLQHFCLGCMTDLDQPDAPCPFCGWGKESENDPDHLAPGSLLAGKYMTGRSLGQGGFGITYLGWDIANQRKVAIKEYYPYHATKRDLDFYTVLPRSAQDAKAVFSQGLDRFFREASNLSRFGPDPNIVSVHDFFYENGTAYIVMEFVDGRTLKQYLLSLGQPMLLGDALALLAPVADALERIHAVRLLHRDISPDNIMFTGDGGTKLLDFGAARGFSLNGEISNTINVKVGYAPKEQFNTHGEQGPWTDVYALAATIYTAITMNVPPPSLARWEGPDPLPRPSEMGIRIASEQEEILLQGMAVDHKKRYPSVRQFYNDLTETANEPRSVNLWDGMLRMGRHILRKVKN